MTDFKLLYIGDLEYSESYASYMPNNCAIIERTADGARVGPCTFYLKDGTTCPRHGVVKTTKWVIDAKAQKSNCANANKI